MEKTNQAPSRLPTLLVGLLIGLILGGISVYWAEQNGLSILSGHSGHEQINTSSATSSETPDAAERKILYYYDPMYPGTHFDQPGKSPFMDMDLIPRYADGSGSGEGVVIDPVQVQNLGLKTASAQKGYLNQVREFSANVEFNRYQEARIQSRAEGFVNSTKSLAIGDMVAAGDEIATITVPDWSSDQSEYLLLKSQNADTRLLGGVREKLRLSGMPEEMLTEVDRTGKVQTSLSITSPVPGVITELSVYPGMNVEKSMVLAVVQGFDPVWVTAEVPQKDLSLVEGGRLRVTSPVWPNRIFEVSSQTLLPKANSQTRTVPLRLTVPNGEGLLRPGLTATVRLRQRGAESIIIPTQSLIDLGESVRVITRLPDGTFLPKAVTVAGSSGSNTAITDGLEQGDEVVVSGLFLIDSEANLAGALDRLKRPEQIAEAPATTAALAPVGEPASDSSMAAPSAGHQAGHN
ncbi:MAG: efflux RND transporter periplasmic adaptor subunit [Deltaproteobacteria bacterium]|jgi:Cu(I)/Ag(I) efflux system membrane fusion protein|nr:efflux RND transporter periplasmic adaptor subunit [Deltaproteobacteria bacterium]